ncbi:MAG: phosphatidylglycerol lysyltransferase domain-containing protein, partial [Candidatus Aminicenantes bacterium]|nr:phosphatidylglycerol lysyltransferase domain-containing protein [Candidatus Aminicenantes bacterium]
MPRFPEFKRVGLEDKAVLEGFIGRFPSEACEVNFANIYTWRDYERTQFTTINGNLCLLCRPGPDPAFFLPPLGTNRIRETIEACLSFCPRLSWVPESFLPHCQGFQWEEDKNNFDYVYRSSDLIHLRGKKYDGKRNRIKKFEKNYISRYLRLRAEHLGACRLLYEDWYAAKIRQDDQIGQAQRVAVLEALARFDELNLVGGAVEVQGRLEAFSMGGKLKADTAVIHIEIANPVYEGLAQFINREFVKNEWAAYEYINREQDMGVAGLRRAKMSY